MKQQHELEHSTWDILDSSKIKCYMTCPRKYFYKYILGWTPQGANIHLIFGEGWHRAMEIILRQGYTAEAVEKGYQELKAYYDKYFSRENYEAYYPKEPNRALEALSRYIGEFDDSHWELQQTEIAGQVPITNDKFLHFRMDAIVRDKKTNKYILIDHKTTGRGGKTWRMKWRNSFQIKLYMHALYSLYDQEQVDKAIINGAIIRKKSMDFDRVIVRLTPRIMEEWMDDAQYWAQMIDAETEGFRSDLRQGNPEEQNTLHWFRQNPTSCMKYGKCPFFDFCTGWGNPVRKTHGEAPIGFEIDRWDPSEMRSNEVVKLSR